MIRVNAWEYRSNALRTTAVAMAVGLVFLVIGVVYWAAPRAVMPGIALSTSPGPLEMERCAECHPAAYEAFADAPHLRTLTPAIHPTVLERFVGRSFQLEKGKDGESKTPASYRFEKRDGALWMISSAWPDPVRVDWVFGSGEHAQTPVSTWTNPKGQTEALELAVSWYPLGNQLGLTLGQNTDEQSERGQAAMGILLDHASTGDCFGCHTSYLPETGGKIDQSRILTGVRCNRCHPRSREHAEAMNAGDYERGEKIVENWSELTPLESILRCGECHRRPDQRPADEITPENEMIIRFAPVGMSESPCFLKQKTIRTTDGSQARMDCLTCHDPHQSASRDPTYYRQKCLNCHGDAHEQASLCTLAPVDSNCLTCHMPKIEVQKNLWFTDHWIRVREGP